MISLNEYNSSNDFGGVIGKLFEARDYAHYVHLHNSSYAKHKALGSFYGKIIIHGIKGRKSFLKL